MLPVALVVHAPETTVLENHKVFALGVGPGLGASGTPSDRLAAHLTHPLELVRVNWHGIPPGQNGRFPPTLLYILNILSLYA